MSLAEMMARIRPDQVPDPAYKGFLPEEARQIQEILAKDIAAVAAASGRDYAPLGGHYFAIDSLYSLDRDDAIGMEIETHGGDEVTFHIAISDIAAFIAKDSPLDLRGVAQAVTRYTRSAAPEGGTEGGTETQYAENIYGSDLSEHFLSLASHQDAGQFRAQFSHLPAEETHDNLLLVCSVTFKGDAIVRTEISRRRGQIHRLSKEEAANWIGRNIRNFEHWADEAGMRLANRRSGVEAVGMDVERNRVPSAEDGRIGETEAGMASVQLMIQEMMILANEQTARIMRQAGVPYMFRNHPIYVMVEDSRGNLSEFGRVYSAKEAEALMRRAERTVSGNLSMRIGGATVEPEMHGHAGLGLESYGWWTSPIRRYTDLVNQRVTHYLLDAVAVASRLDPALAKLDWWGYAADGTHHATTLLAALGDMFFRQDASYLQGFLRQVGAPDLADELRQQLGAPPYAVEEIAYIAEVFNARFQSEKAREAAKNKSASNDPEAMRALIAKAFPDPDYGRLMEQCDRRGFARVLQAALQGSYQAADLTPAGQQAITRALIDRMQDGRLTMVCYQMLLEMDDPTHRWDEARNAVLDELEANPPLAKQILAQMLDGEPYPLPSDFPSQRQPRWQWHHLDVRSEAVSGGQIWASAVVGVAKDGSLWIAGGAPLAFSATHGGKSRKAAEEYATVAFLRSLAEGTLEPLEYHRLPPEIWAMEHPKKAFAAFNEPQDNPPYRAYVEAVLAAAEEELGGVDDASEIYQEIGWLRRSMNEPMAMVTGQELSHHAWMKQIVLQQLPPLVGGKVASPFAIFQKMAERAGMEVTTTERLIEEGERHWHADLWMEPVSGRGRVIKTEADAANKYLARQEAMRLALGELQRTRQDRFIVDLAAEIDRAEALTIPNLASRCVDEQGVHYVPWIEGCTGG